MKLVSDDGWSAASGTSRSVPSPGHRIAPAEAMLA
jgi:hypothetical protein